MVDEPQLEYRSALPEAKRARSRYVPWLWTAVFLAFLVFSSAAGHAPPTYTYTAVLGLTALVLLALSVAAIRDIRRRGRSGVLAVSAGLAMAILATMLLIAGLRGAKRRELAYLIHCHNNLHLIGLATEQYRLSQGFWPRSLEDLVPPPTISCPFNEPAAPYYYIRPTTDHPDPKLVVCFELPSHRDAMNVLLSDGSVRSASGKQALSALAELATGLNPPPSLGRGVSTTLPTTLPH